MTLRIKQFNRYPWTREEAREIAIAVPCPDKVDFSDVVSITHCFADELFSRFYPAKPEIVNASPFVARIVNTAAAAANR